MVGLDGVSWGAGYGEASSGEQTVPTTGMDHGDAEHFTGFITYSMGPMTIGYQEAHIDAGGTGTGIYYDILHLLEEKVRNT